MGKKIILAFDDFETVVDREPDGDRSVLELLRQLLEHRFWYDLENFSRIDLIDFVSCSKFSQKN